MDSTNPTTTNGIDSSLASKVDLPSSCEPTILTKMELVDAPPDVHLENANSQHLVEYINIHRVTDLAKNLIGDSIPAELLSHTVVDLASNPEYSQHLVTNAQFYENADFLSQSFTDEDRRPNIVAVQLIQQPERADAAADEATLANRLIGNKTPLPSVSTIPGDKAVMSSIVPTYVQAVDPTGLRSSNALDVHISSSHARIGDHQHLAKESRAEQDEQIIKLYQPLLHDKLPSLPPLKKINASNTPLSVRSTKYLSGDDSNRNTQTLLSNSNMNSIQHLQHQIPEALEDVKTERVSADMVSDLGESLPNEVYESDCDNENRSSQKSLPHKKRIPSKLKRATNAASARSIHSKSYKCNKCGEQCPTQAAFNVHKQQHSSKKILFACELCNKTCPNQLKFFEHLKSHYEPGANNESPKTDSSQLAEQEFELTPEMETSDTNETNETDIQIIETEDRPPFPPEQHKTLTCGKCNRVFRRQKAFDCHMSISHPNQEDIEEFSEPEDMMEGIRHVVNIAGDDEDKTYEPWRSPSSIENIVLPPQPVSQDETPSSTTTTTTNVKVTTSAKPIKVEVKKENTTYGDDEMPPAKPRKEMACPHCERTFVHRNSLLYHIRSHTGHRPHQCELCGKSFFAAGALKIHLRLHSGDKPYKCEFCGRFFRQWGDLKYHITSLHSDKKMFQCEYCGKDFARKYSLVVHRRIHTGEKNYICEYCTKTFRAASYLQNHRRIHTGEKPHMCHVCGKPFRVRSDMKRHMKTHPDVNVNVLSELPNNSAENSSAAVVGSQPMTSAKQQNMNNITISDTDSELNIKPILPDATGQLDMNGRPESGQPELFTYQRETIEDDRENTNAGTLYVWIQSSTDSILPDT